METWSSSALELSSTWILAGLLRIPQNTNEPARETATTKHLGTGNNATLEPKQLVAAWTTGCSKGTNEITMDPIGSRVKNSQLISSYYHMPAAAIGNLPSVVL